MPKAIKEGGKSFLEMLIHKHAPPCFMSDPTSPAMKPPVAAACSGLGHIISWMVPAGKTPLGNADSKGPRPTPLVLPGAGATKPCHCKISCCNRLMITFLVSHISKITFPENGQQI